MSTPTVPSATPADGTRPAVVRLADTAGGDGPATPGQVADQVQAGRFFWLDLEDPGAGELAAFSQSLRLRPGSVEGVFHASQRSSFAPTGDSVQVVLPAAVDTESTAWLEANYVTVVLTERFLFTVHNGSCPPMLHTRRQYHALEDEEAKADRARVLFMVLDALIGSFRSQLLALDDRLGEIQLGMLHGASPHVHDELVQILGLLTDGIQELGWYSHDLEEVADTVERLPGMRPGARPHFERHRQRIGRIRENGKDIRDQAKDALGHYSELVAGRQARVLSSLTIVATVFLPLSFLTGYFGMNFRILTSDVQTTLWQFVLLGLLLPVGSAAFSLLLIHRLQRRFGVARADRRE